MDHADYIIGKRESFSDSQPNSVDLATQEARSNWNKDQAIRHGGLYVKPDARTPPNPFMAHLPQRDVETTEGMKLTLMNPAYMM